MNVGIKLKYLGIVESQVNLGAFTALNMYRRGRYCLRYLVDRVKAGPSTANVG